MEVDLDSDIMKLGGTCKTCFAQGYRGKQSRIRYKAKPCACVRCRIRINQEYYINNKEVQL